MCKFLGTENVSDSMTKNVTAAAILGYSQRMGLEYIEGRSDIAQQLHAACEHAAERELQSDGNKPVKSRSEPFKADETTSYNQPVDPVISNQSQQAAC